jgi:hypothetical protein
VAVTPSFSAAGSSDQVWGMTERAWASQASGSWDPAILQSAPPNGAGFVGRHAVELEQPESSLTLFLLTPINP